jgi:DNA-binding MarR family transcriptional regulator
MAKGSADLDELARELMGHFDVLTREYLVPQESGQLARSEVAVLAFLAEGGPMAMSEVSVRVGLALSSTTGLIDRLVERRLVERARSERDRRTVRVSLTARGRRALETAIADKIRLARGMLERLEAAEREAMLGLFRKVTSGR